MKFTPNFSMENTTNDKPNNSATDNKQLHKVNPLYRIMQKFDQEIWHNRDKIRIQARHKGNKKGETQDRTTIMLPSFAQRPTMIDTDIFNMKIMPESAIAKDQQRQRNIST